MMQYTLSSIRTACIGFLWVLAIAAPGRAAIIIDDYSHNANDRFTNSSSFIAAGYNLSGVGMNTQGRWVTAISRNVVISAWHSQPTGTVSFYPGNDPGAATVSRNIVSLQKIGSTDLAIGILDTPLPSSIVHYQMASSFLSGQAGTNNNFFISNAGGLQDLEVFMIGRSPFDEGLSGDNRFVINDQAVGRNRITGYSENVPFQGNRDNDSLILVRDDRTSANYVRHEAYLQGGDSGAPAFVEINGSLVLLGTNAFIFSGNGGALIGSGINYVGNQFTEIQNILRVNAIPEPSSLVLACLSSSLLMLRGRKRVLATQLRR